MGQGAYILGCEATRLNPAEKAFFAEADPWGFILFARNVADPDQLRALTDELRAAVGRAAPILIDQEGGRVERMRGPHWRQWMPAADHVKLAGGNAERSMWLRYRLIGEELRQVGIDCNCAPVADVARRRTHPILANRCYGAGAVAVTSISRSVADGLLAAGVLPVIKHMPGHGRAFADSHLNLPVVEASEKELQHTDFAPFAALNDLPMAMTAHIVYSELDHAAATVSSRMIDIMRRDIGFGGLLMSDDISMQALAGSLGERVSAALAAGCDLVTHCTGDLDEMRAVVEASGAMTAAAQGRAEAALAARRPVQETDIAKLEAEQRDLLGGRPYV
jgi:beta-N-acetylhexosaminidase